MSFPKHVIHDNIHGTIELSDAECRIINTKAFQRLRKIKQLGLTNLVFPGADHTRFSHSLGVLNIMGRMARTLERKDFLEPGDVDKLKMAALLHDIGHYPLSHVIEGVYKSRRKSIIKLKSKTNKSAFPAFSDSKLVSEHKKYGHHERLGAKVITERNEIRDILEAENFEPEEIAKIINGEHEKNPIYDQLMHSGLDADRIDYLLRDSSYTGASYGQIDLDYLLKHLNCSGTDVGISYKGQHAIEHYLMSRYFMYTQIVYHKTVMGFESVVRALFNVLADEKIVYDNFDAIQKTVNSDEFIQFNDDYFFQKLAEGMKKCGKFHDSKIYKKYYSVISERKPLKLIREEKVLLDRNEKSVPEAFTSFVTRVNDKLHDELKKYHKSDKEAFFHELKFSVEGQAPYYPITYAHDDEMKKELINIIKKDGSASPLITEPQSIIHHLSKLELKMARLYVLNTDNDDTFVESFKKTVNTW